MNRPALLVSLKVQANEFFPLSCNWLIKVSGSYSRAVSSLLTEIQMSDLNDEERCRNINDRIMRVREKRTKPFSHSQESLVFN